MSHTTEHLPTIDGFPLGAADTDCQMQLQVDGELRHYHEVMTAFEQAFPEAKTMQETMVRYRNLPREGALFPELMTSSARAEWLMPLLRRVLWDHSQGSGAKRWTEALAQMIRQCLPEVQSVSEPLFLAMANVAKVMGRTNQSFGFSRHAAHFAHRLEKSGPVSPAAVEAIRRLLEPGDPPRDRSELEESFSDMLFHSATWYAADDYSWDARLHRDLESLPPKQRGHWRSVFKNESTYGEASKALLAAAKRLGEESVIQGLRRWAGMLSDGELHLSRIGVHVFRRFIHLCRHCGGSAADDLLYVIARAPWTCKSETGWLYHYLQVFEHRSDDRVFACVEALAMNPATATQEVSKKYEVLLTVFGAGAQSTTSSEGVDGYPIHRHPALGAQQAAIDKLLRMGADAAARGRYVDPGLKERLRAMRAVTSDPADRELAERMEAQLNAPTPWFEAGPQVQAAIEAMEDAILKEFDDDLGSLHVALTHRWEWIKEHQPQFTEDTLRVWGRSFRGLGCEGGLLQRSLREVKSLPVDELLRAIKAGPGNLKVFDLAQQYVADHGWHLGLIEELRAWTKTMGTSHTDNYYRAKVEWFLWFEDLAPLKLDECWSHRVKRDLRAMAPKEREAWLGLLNNVTFVIADRPAKKWMTAAEAAFRKMDGATFRRRFIEWFEPFARSEPQRLTIIGRNILRQLMWYALLAKDSAVDDALAGYSKAKWKTKETEKRTAQAEMAFAYVLAERDPAKALPVLEGLVAGGSAFEGSATHKTYLALCTRSNRTAVSAKPEAKKPEKDPEPALLERMRQMRQMVEQKR